MISDLGSGNKNAIPCVQAGMLALWQQTKRWQPEQRLLLQGPTMVTFVTQRSFLAEAPP